MFHTDILCLNIYLLGKGIHICIEKELIVSNELKLLFLEFLQIWLPHSTQEYEGDGVFFLF